MSSNNDARIKVNISGRWVLCVVEDENGRFIVAELRDSAGRVIAVRAPTDAEVLQLKESVSGTK